MLYPFRYAAASGPVNALISSMFFRAGRLWGALVGLSPLVKLIISNGRVRPSPHLRLYVFFVMRVMSAKGAKAAAIAGWNQGGATASWFPKCSWISPASYMAPWATSSFEAPPAPLLILMFLLYPIASAMFMSVGGFAGWAGRGVGHWGAGGSAGMIVWERAGSQMGGSHICDPASFFSNRFFLFLRSYTGLGASLIKKILSIYLKKLYLSRIP